MNILILKIAADYINRCISEKGYYTFEEFKRYNKIINLAHK